MIPTQDLMHNNLARGMVEWRSLQLNHFIKNLPQPIRSGEELSMLERLFVDKDPRNTVSKMCKILLRAEEVEIPPFVRKWEKELGTTRDKKFIGKILNLAHASAVDSRTAEMNYKCLVRWYSTPEKISNFKGRYISRMLERL